MSAHRIIDRRHGVPALAGQTGQCDPPPAKAGTPCLPPKRKFDLRAIPIFLIINLLFTVFGFWQGFKYRSLEWRQLTDQARTNLADSERILALGQPKTNFAQFIFTPPATNIITNKISVQYFTNQLFQIRPARPNIRKPPAPLLASD